jgi:hypothetical protein
MSDIFPYLQKERTATDMTKEEYRFLRERYQQLECDSAPPDTDMMVQLQDAVLRAFLQSEGYHLFWEEETQARIRRQQTFVALAQHGK